MREEQKAVFVSSLIILSSLNPFEDLTIRIGIRAGCCILTPLRINKKGQK
jgi:hypothetical protein